MSEPRFQVTGLPAAHPSLTVATARQLLNDQFPQYARLPLGALSEGWDNAMIPLGDDLALRMPRLQGSEVSLLKERNLLTRLGSAWDFPYPRFVDMGKPGHGYPWPWGIVTWLPGHVAADTPLSEDGAAALGRALAQVHESSPPDAPFNQEQSISLAKRDEAIGALLDSNAETRGPYGETLVNGEAAVIWEEALAAPSPTRTVWSHADLHGFNVLTGADGSFAGIIDWGDIAGCDPAVDLGFIYTLTDAAGVAAALDSYGQTRPHDPGLTRRLRGIALNKSIDLAMRPSTRTSAMGWRGLIALGAALPG